MRLCSIASGSSGNCIYAGNNNTHVLVDVGISGKRIEQGLNVLGLTGNDIDGILITHEHSDHISSLGVMARRYGIPIYATAGTIRGIFATKSLGNIDESLFHVIAGGSSFDINDLRINSVNVSHDANEPVAYRINSGRESVGVCTDLGVYDEQIVECMSGLDALLIEANHDINMLQVGKYPYSLKQRILGDKGHLSNETCGKLLCKLLHDDLNNIYLGHLSAENNYAELAYEAVRLEIMMDRCNYSPGDFNIKVAKRDDISEIYEK